MRRAPLLFAVIIAAVAALTVAAPNASGLTSPSGSAVWWVYYGNGYTTNDPQVYSNRNPTWYVGGNPALTFATNGDFKDLANFCTNGLCWHTGTATSSLPAQLRWLGDGDVTIRNHGGGLLWHTGTGGDAGPNYLVMGFWPNGCLTIHSDPDHTGWGHPFWRNSSNPACDIIASGHS